MSFILVIVLPVILIIVVYFQTQKHRRRHHPPGPPALPFIGNLHQFVCGRLPHTNLHRLSKQYGPIMSLKLGFRRVVVISSADAVKEMVKSHDAVWSSRPGLVSLRRLAYNGCDVAFSPYSNTWREMRKILNTRLLSTKKVESFRPIFKEEVSKMIEKIAMDASSSHVTDLSEAMVSFASNTVCRVAFGKTYQDEASGKNRFVEVLHQTHPILGGFFVGDYLPSLRWIDSLSGMAAKLENKFRDIDSFCEQVIEEHVNPSRPKSMDGDIVDVMLGIITSSLDLRLDHAKALILDIIAGGSDTISAVLVWALTALMKNPSVMKKVQAEMRHHELVGRKDLIDEEDIAKLPYLKAVVKETLRLYLPGPLLISRETLEKFSINGYEIEGGTMVYINAWAIARDPATWENPNEFVPERFLESAVDVRGQDPELIPFGIGRRKCPGIGMSMSEIELALANVVYKFEWELPPGIKKEDIDFEVVPGLAMHKKNALRLVARVATDNNAPT